LEKIALPVGLFLGFFQPKFRAFKKTGNALTVKSLRDHNYQTLSRRHLQTDVLGFGAFPNGVFPYLVQVYFSLQTAPFLKDG
jgi:hypothetical protein